ncbi:MAG: DUF4214 domain-containing protein [Gemmataceae bacterium]
MERLHVRWLMLWCVPLVALLASSSVQAQGFVTPEMLVNGWYRQYLNRAPDPAASQWIQALRTGTSPTVVQSAILGSPEYLRKHGNSRPGFVRGLYQDILGRQPNPKELNHWTTILQQNGSTQRTALMFLQSVQR